MAPRFGISVTAHDPQTKAVTAVTYRFCLLFGLEKGRVTTTKVFRPPFRTDNFHQHLRLSHPRKWTEFECKDFDATRKAYFEVEVPFNETIESHYSSADPGLFVKVEQAVIDVVTRYFIDQAAGESVPPTVARSDADAYLVSIRNERIFKIVMEQISLGLSFREVTLTRRNLRSSCGLGFLNSVTEQKVSQYVKTLCILSLHALTAIISSDEVWSYSLAIDSATHHGTSYLDVRARFIYRGSLRNYHLLAIPFSESHTGQNMFEHVSNLMKVIGGRFWDHKLLAVTTDGAANMTGCHRGMVTLLQGACPNSIYRIWCGAHQLDLVGRDCVSRQLYDCFYQTLTSLVSYLRRQQRLILELGFQCPRVCLTRWQSLGAVVMWILRNRSPISTFIAREDTANFDGLIPYWWLLCFAVEGLMEPVKICFQAVQGKDTLIAEHNGRFEKVVSDVKITFNIRSTSDMTGVDVLSEAALGSPLFSGRVFYCTRDGMRDFFTVGVRLRASVWRLFPRTSFSSCSLFAQS